MNGIAYQPGEQMTRTPTHILSLIAVTLPTNLPYSTESEMMWSAQMRRAQRPVSEQLASGSSLHTMGTSLHLLVEHLATQPDHPQVEHTTREREMTSDGEKVTYYCGFIISHFVDILERMVRSANEDITRDS